MTKRVAPREPANADWCISGAEWTAKTRNGSAFQSMVLDLFAAECGEEHFTRGPTHGGPDGGSDGHYDAPLCGTRGPWKVASAVRTKRADLKRKIAYELRLAKRDRYRGMVFVTQYDLNTKEVTDLQRTRKEEPKVRVWPKSKVQALLQKHRWMKAQHFGHQITPGFVPAASTAEIDLTDQPDLRLVGRGTEIQSFRAFLKGKERILLVVGPGGAGKSRLLREFAGISWRAGRSAWLRLVGRGAFEDAVRELPLHRPVLLCLDDAGRDREETLELARIARAAEGRDARVVLAVRAADRECVEEVLQTARTSVRVMVLESLAHEDAMRVVKVEFPRIPDDVGERLVRLLGRNLFLLRSATRLVKIGESVRFDSDDQLRSLIARKFIAEVKALASNTPSRDRCEQELLDAALDMPLPISATASSELTKTLLEAGLFRRVGNTIRFRADAEGDLLLAHLMTQPWGAARVKERVPSEPLRIPSRIVNLAAAGQGKPAEIVRDMCAAWLRPGGTLEVSQHAVLASLPYCAASAPEQVALICQAYADDTSKKPTTDSFGPILIALARRGHLIVALRLARALLRSGVPEGSFSNYKAPAVGDELACLAYQDLRTLVAACEELGRWLETPDVGDAAELVSSVISTLLSPSVRWTSSESASTHFHEAPLAPTRSTLKMRTAARRVLQQMMTHSERRVRLAAAELLSKQCFGGSGRVNPQAMDDLCREEFEALLPDLNRWFSSESDFEVIDTLLGGFVNRWASDAHGAVAAGRIVAERTLPATFKAFRLVRSPWDWVNDYRSLMAEAPQNDRWKWWIDKQHDLDERQGRTDRDVQGLVAELARECQTGDSLALALQLILAQPAHDQRFQPFYLLDLWCELQAPIFREALQSRALGPFAKGFAERALRRRDWKRNPPLAEVALASAIESGAVNPAREVLSDVVGASPEAINRMTRMLVQADSIDIRALGIRILTPGIRRSVEGASGLVELALRNGDWHAHWGEISHLFYDKSLEELLRSSPSFANALEARILETLQCNDRDGAYRQASQSLIRVVEILCRDDQDRRLRIVTSCLLSESFSAQRFAGTVAAQLVVKEASLRRLLERLEELFANGSLTDVWTVTGLLKNDALRIGPVALPSNAIEIARDFIAKGTRSAGLVGIGLLSQLEGSAEACAELANLSAGDGEIAEIADGLLCEFTYSQGVMSRSHGEPFPQLVLLERTLAAAAARVTPPPVRSRLERMRRHIRQEIETDLRQDEEVADPR